MPIRCAVYNSRGNYDREPYSQVVNFPTNMVERTRWIEAMPNEPGSLKDRKEIYVCTSVYGKFVSRKFVVGRFVAWSSHVDRIIILVYLSH